MLQVIFALTVLFVGLNSFALEKEFKPMSFATYKAAKERILKSIRAESNPETRMMTPSQQKKWAQFKALDARFKNEQKALANLYTSLFNKIDKACHRDYSNTENFSTRASLDCINVYNNLDRHTKNLVPSEDLYEAYSKRSLSSK